MTDKKTQRKKLQQQLSILDKGTHEKLSRQIASLLMEDKDWKEANTIGITISRFPEVDSHQIIEDAWKQGKQVVVPKCYPQDKTMVFRKLDSFEQLEKVFYGLLEPIEEKTQLIKKEQIDLLLVPGLAYTREGYRLGFGGGYYDRYLSGFAGNTISLAFDQQIIESFPVEKFDIPVQKIITNQEIIYGGRNE